MTGLSITHLTKSFATQRVLDGVSLSVAPGEFVALVGPSGIGKTTLLRCIARLTRAESGEIDVCGHDMMRLHGRALRQARQDIGFVFQQVNLVQRRSALENAVAGQLATMPLWRVITGLHKPELEAAAQACLERVGIGEKAQVRADAISGGQQQRVAIARALVQESRLLLADEPIASLDQENAQSILTLLRDLARERQLSVLCSLHQPDLARQFADRVVKLS